MKGSLALFASLVATAAASLAVAQDNTGSGVVENPFRGVMQDRSSRSQDEALYVEKCSMCHRRMGMGTVILARRLNPEQAELEKNPRLNEAYIRLAARQGIGNMPRISRAEVSDDQLARIARYIARTGDK